MIPLRHCLLLTLAASATGCFDDAKLRPYDAGDDLAPVDVPITPADVPEDDGAAAVDGPDGSLDAALDADLDAALDATDDAVTADDLPRPDVPPGECPIDRVLVGTSDSTTAGGYALGRFVPTPSLVARTESAPDYDHLVVQSGCVVYDLLRGADELAVLDPLALPTVARRISLRSAMGSTERYQANPSAVLTLSPQVAYVALYNAPRVAVVDPTMSGPDAVRRVINLAPLRSPMDRDANGALEAAAIVRAGRNVFVALQNLNGGMSVTNGTLAVLDPTGDVLLDTEPGTTEIDPVRLTGRNPTGMRLTPGGRLVVAEPGAPGPQATDGIEVVDPVSFAARGIRVTEARLGGDVGDFIMLDDARGWVVVRQSATSSRVVEFDLDAAEDMRAGRTIMSSSSIGALARDPSGNVWVLDRSAGRAGARVFNTMGTELTMMPLAAGTQPPTSVAFVP